MGMSLAQMNRRSRMLSQRHDVMIQEEVSIANALVEQHGLSRDDALKQAATIVARRQSQGQVNGTKIVADL